jgi:hypothetical protein
MLDVPLEPHETAIRRPYVYLKTGNYSRLASISDATTQLNQNPVVLFTID